MKYTITSKVLSLIGHALIALCFAALGIYFACFTLPFYFNPSAWNVKDVTYVSGVGDWGFSALLQFAVMGFSFATISGYGIFFSVKSILENKDEHVIKSFSCLMAEGYIFALYVFALASIFFDLFSGGNLTFFIIMAILVVIIAMIATNIPMVKTFERRSAKPLYFTLLVSAGIVAAYVAIFATVGLFGNLAYYWQNPDNVVSSDDNLIRLHLIVMIAAFALMCALFVFAAVKVNKSETGNDENAGYLASGAGLLLGFYTVFQGVLALVTKDDYHISFLRQSRVYSDDGYAIMSVIIGSIIVLGSLVAVVLAERKAKKAPVKAVEE